MNNIMVMIQQFWPETLSVITVTFVAAFHAKLKNAILYIVDKVTPRINPFTCFAKTIDTLEKIQAELKPNGGGSLRDAINRIDSKVCKISEKVNLIQANSDIISDTLNICRWSADKKGNINFVNRPLRKLIGAVDNESCTGESWFNNIVEINDRNMVKSAWSQAVHGKSEYHHVYNVINLINNKEIKVTSHAKLITDEDGKLLGWSGIIVPYNENDKNVTFSI